MIYCDNIITIRFADGHQHNYRDNLPAKFEFAKSCKIFRDLFNLIRFYIHVYIIKYLIRYLLIFSVFDHR